MNRQQAIVSVAFGLCAAVGLAGTFSGLGVSSLWVDELFTAWVVGADRDPSAFLERALTDVHPPLYYASLFVYSLGFGTSDAALRAFSAVAAILAIVVFVVFGRGSFSLNARLFAAAMASGSSYWFIQSQNARSNALGLLVGAAILTLSLSLLRQREGPVKRPGAVTALLFLVLFGAFVHFYVGYVGLAVLLSLAALRPDYRALAATSAALLVAALAVYVRLVVEPFGQWLTGTTWMESDVHWYAAQLGSALRSSADILGLGALAVCLVLLASALALASNSAKIGEYWRTWRRHPLQALKETDRVALFLLAVPALVFGGGVVSSILLSPNFLDRSFLLVSPFLWGLAAKLYDAAFDRGLGQFKPIANGALILILVAMSSVVQARAFPRNQLFRESAAWVGGFPECSGQVIPILFDRTADALVITKPGFHEWFIPAARARYLRGVNGMLVPLDQEAPEEVRQAWRERLQGGTCPVLGLSTDPAPLERAREIAAIVADRAGDGARTRVGVEFFPEPAFRRYRRPHDVNKGAPPPRPRERVDRDGLGHRIKGTGLFVIYVKRNDQTTGTQRQ